MQPQNRMKWAVLTSGPYMEMLSLMWSPRHDQATDTYSFVAPLGDHGAVPMIHLDDLGEYARWIFDNPSKSAGMDLEVATKHVHFEEVAQAFTKVTGKKAIYKDEPLDVWLERYAKEDESSAYQVDVNEPGAMTWRKNFTGWYNLWRNSGGDHPVIARDYKLLDQILPNRVRSVEEWMRKVKYDGNFKSILKDVEDKNRTSGFKRT